MILNMTQLKKYIKYNVANPSSEIFNNWLNESSSLTMNMNRRLKYLIINHNEPMCVIDGFSSQIFTKFWNTKWQKIKGFKQNLFPIYMGKLTGTFFCPWISTDFWVVSHSLINTNHSISGMKARLKNLPVKVKLFALHQCKWDIWAAWLLNFPADPPKAQSEVTTWTDSQVSQIFTKAYKGIVDWHLQNLIISNIWVL